MQSLLKLASIPRAALRSGAVLAPQWHAASVYASTLSPFTRSFASDKKKGKKQQAAPVEEKKKSDSKIPINILADGKDPEVLPDDQYPDWLWHMLDPKVTPDEWETRNFKGMTEKDMTDVIRIKAARRIKRYNLSKAK